MQAKISELQSKLVGLKGSAKSIVERKIAELEASVVSNPVNFNLTSLSYDTEKLVDELIVCIADLEDRLSPIMNVMPKTGVLLAKTDNMPAALKQISSTNSSLRSCLAMVKDITNSVQI